jgi:ferredoxin-NADP reductase
MMRPVEPREELETIAAGRGARLVYVIGRSSDPATAITPESLAAAVAGIVDRDVYICASPRFSSAMRSTLLSAGVPKGRVHQEDFAF